MAQALLQRIELDTVKENISLTELGELSNNEEETKPLSRENQDGLESEKLDTVNNIPSRSDHNKSLIRKTRELIRKENDYKLVDRFVFTTIIIIEQVIMLVVLRLFTYSENTHDLHLTIFYSAVIPIFVFGNLLEAIYYTFLNPEAKYRQRIGCRKSSLSLTLFTLFITGLVSVLYLLYEFDQIGYFIIILTIIVVLTLSMFFFAITSSCCARHRIKRREKGADF